MQRRRFLKWAGVAVGALVTPGVGAGAAPVVEAVPATSPVPSPVRTQGFNPEDLSELVKESFENTFWQAFERNNDFWARLEEVRQ